MCHDPKMRQRVFGWVGIVVHCTVVAFLYYASLLLAPPYAVFSLWALWAVFLALAVYFLRRRPGWALAVPALAFAVWLSVISLGGWLLGWTA